MTVHKFMAGQSVDLIRRGRQGGEPASCEILRQLSTDGDDPQYRVKCPAESFERVVRESELMERDAG